MGIIAAPVLLLLAGGLGVVSGDLDAMLAAFAVACATLGVAVGVSNLASVLAPYAVPERPTNAFSGLGRAGVRGAAALPEAARGARRGGTSRRLMRRRAPVP